MSDLRQWLEQVDKMGELRRIEGADWDLEIGCITAMNWKRKDQPALLFDSIKDYAGGYRILTCSVSTPNRVALMLNLPLDLSNLEYLALLRQKFPCWEAELDKFKPQVVKTGPILENVHSGDDVDLLEFPVPKWHDLDGGRYIGTGDAVITRDPDTGAVNLGTYRMMVHDRNAAALWIVPDHHGSLHIGKYHRRGERCPVAVSIGQHPLINRVACLPVPEGAEYPFIGAIMGEPVNVITEEITGLPIPADSEIVIAGWCYPGKGRVEGPFGEWTGYYASEARPSPVIEVERIYHRNNPIIVGSPPGRSPSEGSYFLSLVRSAQLHNELMKAGLPDVQGVWISEEAGGLIITVSIKQRYPGHAKDVALFISQSKVGYWGRYVIVLDDDIDPTNIHDVLWALATRSDPEKSIDIIRRARGAPLDPMVRKPATSHFTSRAIIEACKPYEWISEFPKVIDHDRELADRVKLKWFPM